MSRRSAILVELIRKSAEVRNAFRSAMLKYGFQKDFHQELIAKDGYSLSQFKRVIYAKGMEEKLGKVVDTVLRQEQVGDYFQKYQLDLMREYLSLNEQWERNNEEM